ncbi:hypothetical protein AVEN_155016-1 [Araneus ventricosus]|uniref:Uncharacterized protein n=1 Tax=Araneus ventricosus TaxID=182803 RepID=A0A4Y2A793_ARAVE|nr:hypothetical protein AVEN_155016-1 [Araneus ventricosus]
MAFLVKAQMVDLQTLAVESGLGIIPSAGIFELRRSIQLSANYEEVILKDILKISPRAVVVNIEAAIGIYSGNHNCSEVRSMKNSEEKNAQSTESKCEAIDISGILTDENGATRERPHVAIGNFSL